MVGGIAGGLLGGLDALDKGTNFWTGKTSLDLSQGYAASVNFKISETTVTGKYAGTYKGQNVFESSKLGSYKTGKYSGVTIPERGIIVGKGVFTYRAKEGMAMMQHEFGHILEYRIIGPRAYWSVIAPESLCSASLSSCDEDHIYWTETWANYLSKRHFGVNWLGKFFPGDYPVQNISPANKMKIYLSTHTHYNPNGMPIYY